MDYSKCLFKLRVKVISSSLHFECSMNFQTKSNLNTVWKFYELNTSIKKFLL